MMVISEENLNGIRKALQKAGNTHFQAESLTGLNHLFQPAKTGAVSEYARSELPLIHRRCKGSPSGLTNANDQQRIIFLVLAGNADLLNETN